MAARSQAVNPERASRWRRPPLGIAAVVALLLSACAPTAAPARPAAPAAPAAQPAAPAASAPAPSPVGNGERAESPPLIKTRVVHSAVAGSQALLQVLQDAGIFARHGLEVETSNIGGRTATAGLLAGEYPLVVTSGAEVVGAGIAGADVVAVAAALNTLDTSIWTREVRDPAELRGKRIGVTQLGDSTDFAARFAARRWGLDPATDVQIVQVGQPPERLAALESGAVDATILQPPLTTRARKLGLTKLTDVASLGLEYQHTVVITTRRRIAEDPEPVARFVRAWAEGLYYYRANPEPSRAAVGKFMRIDDPEALAETYAHYRDLYVVPPYPSVKGIQAIVDVLAESDDRARGARPEDFVDTRFLDALQASGQFQAWDQQYQ
ncbi:MAG TPA: ABC transporter substrate-binding protein [Chloroflexota bacterium]|nr:ABC transporter substrate-binding protein [Chloroflexota bacterium]